LTTHFIPLALESIRYFLVSLMMRIKKPNPQQTWPQLFAEAEWQLNITGTAYFWTPPAGCNEIEEVYVIPPTWVVRKIHKGNCEQYRIKPDPWSAISHYSLNKRLSDVLPAEQVKVVSRVSNSLKTSDKVKSMCGEISIPPCLESAKEWLIPLLETLKEPNPEQTWDQLFAVANAWIQDKGHAYLWLVPDDYGGTEEVRNIPCSWVMEYPTKAISYYSIHLALAKVRGCEWLGETTKGVIPIMAEQIKVVRRNEEFFVPPALESIKEWLLPMLAHWKEKGVKKNAVPNLGQSWEDLFSFAEKQIESFGAACFWLIPDKLGEVYEVHCLPTPWVRPDPLDIESSREWYRIHANDYLWAKPTVGTIVWGQKIPAEQMKIVRKEVKDRAGDILDPKGISISPDSKWKWLLSNEGLIPMDYTTLPTHYTPESFGYISIPPESHMTELRQEIEKNVDPQLKGMLHEVKGIPTTRVGFQPMITTTSLEKSPAGVKAEVDAGCVRVGDNSCGFDYVQPEKANYPQLKGEISISFLSNGLCTGEGFPRPADIETEVKTEADTVPVERFQSKEAWERFRRAADMEAVTPITAGPGLLQDKNNNSVENLYTRAITIIGRELQAAKDKGEVKTACTLLKVLREIEGKSSEKNEKE
jgi:hypothetical protein